MLRLDTGNWRRFNFWLATRKFRGIALDLVVAVFALGFLGTIGLVTGLLARRKGYQFLPWFLAGGIIGLIALSFQPFANDPALSGMEQRYKAESGNRLGWKLAVVCIGLAIIRFMVMS